MRCRDYAHCISKATCLASLNTPASVSDCKVVGVGTLPALPSAFAAFHANYTGIHERSIGGKSGNKRLLDFRARRLTGDGGNTNWAAFATSFAGFRDLGLCGSRIGEDSVGDAFCVPCPGPKSCTYAIEFTWATKQLLMLRSIRHCAVQTFVKPLSEGRSFSSATEGYVDSSLLLTCRYIRPQDLIANVYCFDRLCATPKYQVLDTGGFTSLKRVCADVISHECSITRMTVKNSYNRDVPDLSLTQGSLLLRRQPAFRTGSLSSYKICWLPCGRFTAAILASRGAMSAELQTASSLVTPAVCQATAYFEVAKGPRQMMNPSRTHVFLNLFSTGR